MQYLLSGTVPHPSRDLSSRGSKTRKRNDFIQQIRKRKRVVRKISRAPRGRTMEDYGKRSNAGPVKPACSPEKMAATGSGDRNHSTDLPEYHHG